MKMNLVMVEDTLSVMSFEEFYSATFNPETEYKFFFTLEVSGKNYKERKSDLEEKAHEYQNATSEYTGLSYGEYAILDRFFEDNGRRYGILTEFRENCIY